MPKQCNTKQSTIPDNAASDAERNTNSAESIKTAWNHCRNAAFEYRQSLDSHANKKFLLWEACKKDKKTDCDHLLTDLTLETEVKLLKDKFLETCITNRPDIVDYDNKIKAEFAENSNAKQTRIITVPITNSDPIEYEPVTISLAYSQRNVNPCIPESFAPFYFLDGCFSHEFTAGCLIPKYKVFKRDRNNLVPTPEEVAVLNQDFHFYSIGCQKKYDQFAEVGDSMRWMRGCSSEFGSLSTQIDEFQNCEDRYENLISTQWDPAIYKSTVANVTTNPFIVAPSPEPLPPFCQDSIKETERLRQETIECNRWESLSSAERMKERVKSVPGLAIEIYQMPILGSPLYQHIFAAALAFREEVATVVTTSLEKELQHPNQGNKLYRTVGNKIKQLKRLNETTIGSICVELGEMSLRSMAPKGPQVTEALVRHTKTALKKPAGLEEDDYWNFALLPLESTCPYVSISGAAKVLKKSKQVYHCKGFLAAFEMACDSVAALIPGAGMLVDSLQQLDEVHEKATAREISKSKLNSNAAKNSNAEKSDKADNKSAAVTSQSSMDNISDDEQRADEASAAPIFKNCCRRRKGYRI